MTDLPSHLSDIVQIGAMAADEWDFDHRDPATTEAERCHKIVQTAVEHLVAVGLLTPCTLDEYAAKLREGIPTS